jgi:very-short-patch-repair endonuclease
MGRYDRNLFAGKYVAQEARRAVVDTSHAVHADWKDRETLPELVALCRASKLPEPKPEHRFHPTRKWLFDYAWPEHQLALEVEGGIWRKGGGAHSHPMNIVRDCEKYSEAALLGWRILRVPPEKLRTVGMEYLFRAFAMKPCA